MALDLVQRLKTCPKGERRDVAMELAKTGTDEAVAELIRMVEGRHRNGLRWYNYNDQLVGIEALGMSKSVEALGYLSRVYSSMVVFTTKYTGTHTQEDGYGVYLISPTQVEVVVFPLARKKLRRRLAVSPRLENDLDEQCPKGYLEAERSEIFSRESHSTIQRAIRELEASTGKTAQIVLIGEDYATSWLNTPIPQSPVGVKYSLLWLLGFKHNSIKQYLAENPKLAMPLQTYLTYRVNIAMYF